MVIKIVSYQLVTMLRDYQSLTYFVIPVIGFSTQRIILDAYALLYLSNVNSEDNEPREDETERILPTLRDYFAFDFIFGFWYSMIAAIATWLFDWYIFSPLWMKMKSQDVVQ